MFRKWLTLSFQRENFSVIILRTQAAFYTHTDEGILCYAYDTKVILIPSEEKFKGKIAYVEEQKKGNISIVNGGGAVNSEDRKRSATTPRNVLE